MELAQKFLLAIGRTMKFSWYGKYRQQLH